MSSAPGQNPGPMRQTPNADGQAADAPQDMSAACEQAVDAAISHGESEGRKVAMGVQQPLT
jgi:hypothetical protein